MTQFSERTTPKGLAESVFEAFHEEPAICLLPEWEDPQGRQKVLEETWPGLFEAMLSGWVPDEALWPKERSSEMFREWFDVEMSSVGEDLWPEHRLGYL